MSFHHFITDVGSVRWGPLLCSKLKRPLCTQTEQPEQPNTANNLKIIFSNRTDLVPGSFLVILTDLSCRWINLQKRGHKMWLKFVFSLHITAPLLLNPAAFIQIYLWPYSCLSEWTCSRKNLRDFLNYFKNISTGQFEMKENWQRNSLFFPSMLWHMRNWWIDSMWVGTMNKINKWKTIAQELSLSEDIQMTQVHCGNNQKSPG